MFALPVGSRRPYLDYLLGAGGPPAPDEEGPPPSSSLGLDDGYGVDGSYEDVTDPFSSRPSGSVRDCLDRPVGDPSVPPLTPRLAVHFVLTSFASYLHASFLRTESMLTDPHHVGVCAGPGVYAWPFSLQRDQQTFLDCLVEFGGYAAVLYEDVLAYVTALRSVRRLFGALYAGEVFGDDVFGTPSVAWTRPVLFDYSRSHPAEALRLRVVRLEQCREVIGRSVRYARLGAVLALVDRLTGFLGDLLQDGDGELSRARGLGSGLLDGGSGQFDGGFAPASNSVWSRVDEGEAVPEPGDGDECGDEDEEEENDENWDPLGLT